MRQNGDWNDVIKNDEDIAEANKIAQESGFDKAFYVGEWNGYKVFSPEARDAILYTGLPVSILVKDGKGRYSRGKETFEILDAFNKNGKE